MKRTILKLMMMALGVLLPMNVKAYDCKVNGIYYNLSGNEAEVTYDVQYSSSNYSGSITIPSTIRYKGKTYSVTSIGVEAFDGCIYLTDINIPNSVTSIGDWAFCYCCGLTSITIPNSVTSIGGCAFEYCEGLTSITIPNSVTSIGNGAFSHCSGLTSINIPNSVTSIGDWAFCYCCGLTSITIPNSVTSIGGCAFEYCEGLTSITIPNSVTSIGDGAFSGTAWFNNQPDGLVYASNVAYKYKGTMPSNTTITLKEGTVGIAGEAFKGCRGLTSITIPNNVTNIGYGAFDGCSGLTSITIPNNVTTIGKSAFSGCSGLTSITIPNSVTNIGYGAFDGCSGLTSITIPNNVTTIEESAFSGCSGLTSITIPNSVTNIGYGAFDGCSGLTAVHISDLASWCGISFGQYSANPLQYAHHLFLNGVEIQDLAIPNSVTSIGGCAFSGCSGLTSITIPNSVTSIGNYVFSGCRGLTSITIPNSVTSIGEYAFRNCGGLTSVVSEIEEPFAFGSSAFSSISSNCVLTVPYGTKNAYIAKGWTTNVFKGGIVEVPGPKCDTPTITFTNGKLTFSCETEGAEYVVSCSTNINNTLTGDILNLMEVACITVSVYATAPNHDNSETVTETFAWPNGDMNSDGFVNISDVTALVNIILGKSEPVNPTNFVTIYWGGTNDYQGPPDEDNPDTLPIPTNFDYKHLGHSGITTGNTYFNTIEAGHKVQWVAMPIGWGITQFEENGGHTSWLNPEEGNSAVTITEDGDYRIVYTKNYGGGVQGVTTSFTVQKGYTNTEF